MESYDFLLNKFIEDLKKEITEDAMQDFIHEPDVIVFHHTLGRNIRNRYDLWHKHKHLGHPDSVSHRILKDAQKILKTQGVAAT